MSESERVIVAFNTGELSPELGGRSDIERMSAGCREVQNMKLGVFGFAERRPGLEFIGYAKQSEPAAEASPSPSPSPSPSTLLDDLVEWWDLDEVSGNRAGSHGALTLTDNNTVTSAAGVAGVGTAAQFTRANSEYLDRASDANMQVGDIDFEFSAWVYLDTKTGGSFNYILSKRNAPTVREYFLDYVISTDRFRFGVSADGTNNVSVSAATFGTASTGTWYFITCYHDAATNVIGIAINNGTPDTAAHSTGVIVGAGDFTIGAGDNTPTIFWDGRIAKVGFWKRLLTASERTELYNAGAGATYPFN